MAPALYHLAPNSCEAEGGTRENDVAWQIAPQHGHSRILGLAQTLFLVAEPSPIGQPHVNATTCGLISLPATGLNCSRRHNSRKYS